MSWQTPKPKSKSKSFKKDTKISIQSTDEFPVGHPKYVKPVERKPTTIQVKKADIQTQKIILTKACNQPSKASQAKVGNGFTKKATGRYG